jgi:hypothetical protein
MKTLTAISLSAAFALAMASGAHAQTYSPAVPTLANPHPANPIATNGTPLPRGPVEYNGSSDGVPTGRSVFAPVGAAVDLGAGVAGAAVNAGVATVGAGLNVVPATADALTGR